MRTEGVVNAPFRKRLFAALINLLLFLLLGFVFDYLVMPVTYQKWMGHNQIEQECVVLNNSYHDKQDEYGIYYYNDDGKRLYNYDVSEETITNFQNDQSVRDIVSELSNKQTHLYIIDISSYVISFLFISLLITILTTFVLGKYKSFGGLFLGLYTVSETLDNPKTSKILGYACLRWLLLIPLGVISVFMIPVVFLYQIYYHDDHSTKLEKRFHLITIER